MSLAGISLAASILPAPASAQRLTSKATPASAPRAEVSGSSSTEPRRAGERPLESNAAGVNASAPGQQSVTCPKLAVDVDVAPEVDQCPTASELASWVNALAGGHVAASTVELQRSNPACLTAPSALSASASVPTASVLVRVEPAPSTPEPEPRAPALAASLILQRAPNATAVDSPLRSFVEHVSCEELLRVAALSISLLVAPVSPIDETATSEDESSTPSGELPEPAAPRTAVISTAPSDAGSTAATLAPATNPHPLASQPRATQSRTAQPQTAEAPVTAPHATDPTRNVAFMLGAAGSAGGGLNPGLNLGGELSAGLGRDAWSLRAYASLLTSVKAKAVRTSGLTGSVRSRTFTVGATPCFTVGARTLGGEFDLCLDAAYVTFDARGRGFDVNATDTLHFWCVGGHAVYLWPISGSLRGSLGFALLAPLAHVDMRLSGVDGAIWDMAPITGRLSLGLDWR